MMYELVSIPPVTRPLPKKKAKYFENGVSYDWQHSQNFREMVENFANNFAKSPDMSEAKQLNEKIMKEIETKLKNESLCTTLEFVGSVYEGLKVKGSPKKEDDLEFDIMVIWILDEPINIIPTQLTNYSLIKYNGSVNESTMPKCKQFDKNGYLSPNLVANYFLGKIQNCIDSLSCLEEIKREIEIKLRKHGPAIQMDVYKVNAKSKSSSTIKFYSVDIVPTLKFYNKEYYVAKELKYNILTSDVNFERYLTWRKSNSLDEKEILKAIDSGHGNRKKLLRVLKAIRNNEPSLQSLTSYHFKNILLRVNDKTNAENWTDHYLGERLMDLILELKNVLSSKNLPNFFQKGINLLEGMNDKALKNMENRFRKMHNSYHLMKKLLKAPKRTITPKDSLNENAKSSAVRSNKKQSKKRLEKDFDNIINYEEEDYDFDIEDYLFDDDVINDSDDFDDSCSTDGVHFSDDVINGIDGFDDSCSTDAVHFNDDYHANDDW